MIIENGKLHDLLNYFYVRESNAHVLRRLVHGFFESRISKVIREKGKLQDPFFKVALGCAVKRSDYFYVRESKTHALHTIRLVHGFF